MKKKKENLDEEILDSEEREEELEEEVKEEAEEKESEDELSEEEKLRDSYLRLQADFANFKRRAENEKLDIYKYASEKLIVKLLTVVDNLDRALAEVKEEDSFTEGVSLVRQQLLETLEGEGLEEIESDGQKFDANLHHAVLMEESEEVESECIIETFQKGYKLNDKVIRPAMVKVSK